MSHVEPDQGEDVLGLDPREKAPVEGNIDWPEQPRDICGEKLFHRWDNEQSQELEQIESWIEYHLPISDEDKPELLRLINAALVAAYARGREHNDVAIAHPLREQLAAEREKYQELLYAVERKWPNETRHQTALRYIQHAERKDSEQLGSVLPTGEYNALAKEGK
jgi:hypothetical protein